MATSFEPSFQPEFSHARYDFVTQKVQRKAEDFGVVMAATHLHG